MNLRFLYCIPWCPSPLGRTLMQSWRDLGGVWPPALPNLLCSTRHTFAISGVGKPYLKLSARHPESQFYASCNETTSQPCYHVTLKSFPFDKLTDMSVSIVKIHSRPRHKNVVRFHTRDWNQLAFMKPYQTFDWFVMNIVFYLSNHITTTLDTIVWKSHFNMQMRHLYFQVTSPSKNSKSVSSSSSW